jgi:HTH-type transcriptional regulator / antitoxin HipB
VDASLPSPLALGRALRDARRARSLTQAQVAEISGVAQPTVSNVERGASSVSFGTLLRILAALQLELVLKDRPSETSAAPWEQRR